jgi:hypothetical protein
MVRGKSLAYNLALFMTVTSWLHTPPPSTPSPSLFPYPPPPPYSLLPPFSRSPTPHHILGLSCVTTAKVKGIN